jgi:hypothetical protein
MLLLLHFHLCGIFPSDGEKIPIACVKMLISARFCDDAPIYAYDKATAITHWEFTL